MPSPHTTGDRAKRHGLNLPKVLVVVTCISMFAILVALRVPTITVCTYPAPERNDAASLETAVALFRASYGFENCPTVEDLRRDRFLSEDRITEDAWGTPYRIVCEPESAVVVSAGPDLTFGTEDDIFSDGP
jgi:hypothetical protein